MTAISNPVLLALVTFALAEDEQGAAALVRAMSKTDALLALIDATAVIADLVLTFDEIGGTAALRARKGAP